MGIDCHGKIKQKARHFHPRPPSPFAFAKYQPSENSQGNTSAKTLENAKKGIELHISLAVLLAGYISFLCPYTFCQLLLGQTGS